MLRELSLLPASFDSLGICRKFCSCSGWVDVGPVELAAHFPAQHFTWLQYNCCVYSKSNAHLEMLLLICSSHMIDRLPAKIVAS